VKVAVKRALLLVAVAGLVACGPTVGDACTTRNDCLNRTCLNGDGVPGGYCTQPCSLSDPNTCPTGSICVRDGLSNDSPGCFRTCRVDSECRTGYVCRTEKGMDQTICVGPLGL
jgi:hypothetical protein